jgi:hydrogenase nickel incorporation protein HypB
VLIINKIDLLPVLPFDIDQVKTECVSLSRDVTVFEVSAKTGHGVDGFCRFLAERRDTLSP